MKKLVAVMVLLATVLMPLRAHLAEAVAPLLNPQSSIPADSPSTTCGDRDGIANNAPAAMALAAVGPLAHGGGLNACGCHFNRRTGECHCHRAHACGCACEPSHCR